MEETELRKEKNVLLKAPFNECICLQARDLNTNVTRGGSKVGNKECGKLLCIGRMLLIDKYMKFLK